MRTDWFISFPKVFPENETLPSCGYVKTTVWMYHMDVNKMHRQNARCELFKNATRYFEKNLEATHHEITAVWPLTFHLKNHPSKTNMRNTREKANTNSCDVILRTPTHGVSWPTRIYLRQPCTDTGSDQKDLPRAMANRNGRRERERERERERVGRIRAVNVTWW